MVISTYTILFWVGVAVLAAIFLIWCIGIVRANHETYSELEVACAGSVDSSYPEKIKIKLPDESRYGHSGISGNATASLTKFIVKGNSMQYARIHSDDIIYVSHVDPDTLRNSLPKITLLDFKPTEAGSACHKIRRSWRILNSDIDTPDFISEMNRILASSQFADLRVLIGEKCPSDNELMRIALESLRKHQDRGTKSGDILISTTFRTERDRLEFSIHSLADLKGIVSYVVRRKKTMA